MYAPALLVSFMVQAASALPRLSERSVAYYDPSAGGGSMLTDAGSGGEPLNVIISGLSSPEVLSDDGFLNFAKSLGFSDECLDLHLGDPQTANLGDGNGWVDQTTELRQDYGSSVLGTCLESLIGGNHLRMFRQDGANADSGALFLAVSKEENVLDHHTIAADGYDVGRNNLVKAAVGTTSFSGVSYTTSAENVTDLLAAGSDGINHDIAQDGVVTLLTVTVN